MERVLDLEVPVVTKGQVAPDAVDYARVKIAHAARHGSAVALHAVVRLTQAADPAQARPAIAEATLDLGGSVVRAHVAATTMPRQMRATTMMKTTIFDEIASPAIFDEIAAI